MGQTTLKPKLGILNFQKALVYIEKLKPSGIAELYTSTASEAIPR
jgi:hypothetical protein